MIVERRGSCDRCGLCMMGRTDGVWSRPYDGAPEACTVADFAERPVAFRDWPVSWQDAYEGCHITFWTSGRRILGKRVAPDNSLWLYPDPAVTVDA